MNAISFFDLKHHAIQKLCRYHRLGMADDMLYPRELCASSLDDAIERTQEWPVEDATTLIRLFPSLLPLNWQACQIDTTQTASGDWILTIKKAMAA